MSDHNAIRTTAKPAKHGTALYADGDELGQCETECGYWRERDLGDGRILLEWVDEKDVDEEAAEDESRAYTGIRGRDWLAPTPPRRPTRDWLATPPDKPWRLPNTPPARRRDWLAPSPPLPEALSFGSWTNPRGAGAGLLVVGRMVPFNSWTVVRSAKEGNFVERFAPGSLSKSIGERGARIRALFQHGTDPLLGRQPIAAIDEMWEREDGAHYRSRLLAGVPGLVVSGLHAGLYGSSVSFRARRFERVTHPSRNAHNPDGLEERTITEADVYEFSFVTFPQYEGATARVADDE